MPRGRPRNGVPYKHQGVYKVRDFGGSVRILRAQNMDEAIREIASASPQKPSNAPTTDPLAAWFQRQKPTPEGFETSVNPPNPEPTALAPTEIPSEAPKPGTMALSDAERQQYHGLLSNIVSRLNVVGIAYFVKLFGKRPEEPQPKDLELLGRAWEAQLSQWFGSTTIQPWVLILAASAGLGFAMWAGGEPIVRQDAKPSDSLSGNPPPAPGTPSN